MLGIDVGETFTDAVPISGDGTMTVSKTPTLPGREWESVIAAIRRLQCSPPMPIRHGTTIATNAVIEWTGADIALVTTRGHRDVLEIARAVRQDLYDIQSNKPEPLVPRDRRLEIDERLDYQGNVVREVNPNELEALADALSKLGVQSLAVSFLHSYMNPEHEQRLREFLTDRMPGFDVSLSSDVCPQFREYERTSTTVINAYIKRKMSAYLTRLQTDLKALGYEQELLVMQSNAGMAPAAFVSDQPVHSLLSGVAAGSAAVNFLGQMTQATNVVGLDMGGTSCDSASVSMAGQRWPPATK